MMKNKLELKFRMNAKGNIKGEASKAPNACVTREECDRFLDNLEDHIRVLRLIWHECYEKKETEE